MLILFRKYILLQEFVLQIDDNIVILYNAFQGTILHKPNLKKLKIYMNPTKRSKTAKATSKPIKDLVSVCYYGLCAALTCFLDFPVCPKLELIGRLSSPGLHNKEKLVSN